MLTFRNLLSTAILITLCTVCTVSCRKDEPLNYSLQGKITNARNGAGLGDVHVEVQQQVVEDGVFSALYTEAAETMTAPDGGYSLTWPRENVAGLRILLEKDQFFPRQIDLSVSAVGSGDVYTFHSSLYPEAFITVNLANLAPGNPLDEFAFRFDDAQFDCTCCNEDWKYFSGSDVDSTFTCKLYGDTWLKYVQQITTLETDTLIVDSIWCPSFQETTLNIGY